MKHLTRAVNCYASIVAQEIDLKASGPAVLIPIIASHIQAAEKAAAEAEREEFVVIIRRLTTYVDAYGPRDHINGAVTKKLVKDARALTELEKARASEGKG
jgi:hypothetical protein